MYQDIRGEGPHPREVDDDVGACRDADAADGDVPDGPTERRWDRNPVAQHLLRKRSGDWAPRQHLHQRHSLRLGDDRWGKLM